jgi:hypothetical protein
LAGRGSDHDRRGVYAAPTRLFWRLAKPPTHLDGPLPEQFSWEAERFCDLARQGNPTVLEVRLLHAGIHVLRTGEVLVDVSPLRDRLLAIRSGTVPFPEVEQWAATLQDDLAAASAATALPEAPDLEAIDQLLLRLREEGLK